MQVSLEPEGRFQSAPWRLHGQAIIGVKLLRKDTVQRLTPPNAKVFCVWPGRALAMLYIAQYRRSPVGEYREVIVAPAVIRRGAGIGFWISHILVDNDLSVAAGRSIWSLPKRRASIRWERTLRSREVIEVPDMNLRVSFEPPRRAMRLPFIGAAIGGFGRAESWFNVRGMARVGTAFASIESDDQTAIGALGLTGPLRMFVCTHMDIVIGRPTHWRV
jgi:hypothetical protein